MTPETNAQNEDREPLSLEETREIWPLLSRADRVEAFSMLTAHLKSEGKNCFSNFLHILPYALCEKAQIHAF